MNRYNAEPTQFTQTRHHMRRMSFFADKAVLSQTFEAVKGDRKFQLTPEKPVEKYSDDAAALNVRNWGDDGATLSQRLSPTNC